MSFLLNSFFYFVCYICIFLLFLSRIYLVDFLTSFVFLNVLMVVYSILKVLLIFIIVAFFTLAERKILGAVHRRRGPFTVGVFGLLQPIADALKLFFKELLYPLRANNFVFLSAPWWVLTLSVIAWFVIPFHFNIFDVSSYGIKVYLDSLYNDLCLNEYIKCCNLYALDTNVAILILLVISSLNVYGIILSGWSSNSKYAFLGGLRSAAQMISYEVSLGLTILPVILLSNSMNFADICIAQSKSVVFMFMLLPSFIIFIISMLAETNRTPFDLPEAEAELVAGYNVEYSAITFAMFFLGEYSNMLLMATLCVLLFWGGFGGLNHLLLPCKIIFFCFIFIIVRASVPRFRYDQLMQLCWKTFLPVTLGFFLFCLVFTFWLVRA